MYQNVYALYYFEKNSGILLYTNTTIIETKAGDPSTYFNHNFIRELEDYPDLTEEIDKSSDTTNDLVEYLTDNTIPIIIMVGIIGGTTVSIWVIHKKKIKRMFEEFKEITREEKTLERSKKRKTKT